MHWRKILGYLIGLGAFVIIIYAGGAESVWTALNPRLDFLLLYFLANLFLYITSSARWGYTVNQIEGRKVCPQFDYFLFFMSGRFFGQYVSQTGGDLLLRPGLLSKTNHISLQKGIYAIGWEKVFDLVLVTSMLPSALLYLFNLISGYAAIILALVIFGVTAGLFIWKSADLLDTLRKLLLWLMLRLSSLPLLRQPLDKYHEKIKKLDKMVFLGRKTLLWLVTLTFIRQIFVVSRHYFLVAALGLSIPLAVLLAGVPIAQSTLLLAFTPGALGILEGGWYVVFSLAGIPLADGVTFLLGQRVYSLIATSLIFLTIYLIFGLRQFWRWAYVHGPAQGVEEWPDKPSEVINPVHK
jgi:uncharacterized protein (TIRG00374 family)